ncbi:MAG: hypothetical protein IJ086_01275 [Clostridium sp.]|nr:hypothetical protein [Clostridium sp.]
MTVDKEILAQIEQKQKEKELKDALKQVKKGKKKKAMLGLLAFLKMACGAIKATVIWTCKKIKFIFTGLNSFREAINAHVDIDIAKTGPTNPSKIRNKFYAGMTATCLLGMVIGYLGHDKISDTAIAFKSIKGEKVVMASEMAEDDAKKINNVDVQDNTKSTEDVKKQENQQSKAARTVGATNGTSVIETVLSKDVTLYLVGDVSTKFELGDGVQSKGSIVDSGKGEIKYGQLSSLSSKEDDVLEFCRYLKANHNDVYTTVFSTAKGIGTKEFNDCWEKASQYNEFINMQIEYKWNKLVKPVVETISKETKVDLNKTLVGQEIAYSTVSQYGSEKAIEILRNSQLNPSMSEIEIINTIQDEKINSLGTYTYTDAESFDNAYREIIKTRTNNERIELTRLLGKPSDSIK